MRTRPEILGVTNFGRFTPRPKSPDYSGRPKFLGVQYANVESSCSVIFMQTIEKRSSSLVSSVR